MLGLPPWGWTYSTDNHTGTPNATLLGTAVQSAGSAHNEGSDTALLTLSHDCEYMVIGVSNTGTSTVDNRALLDIRFDPAGGTSYSDVITDLLVGGSPDMATLKTASVWYHFPIWIPSGSQIAARLRAATAAKTARVVIYCKGGPTRPEMWWCGQKVEALGISTASSGGTAITSGTSGTYGSWTTIGSSGQHYGAMSFSVQIPDNSSVLHGYYFQAGYNSTQLPGSPTLVHLVGSQEQGTFTDRGPIFCDVPAGTSWEMRGTCGGSAGLEALTGAIYGVY